MSCLGISTDPHVKKDPERSLELAPRLAFYVISKTSIPGTLQQVWPENVTVSHLEYVQMQLLSGLCNILNQEDIFT